MENSFQIQTIIIFLLAAVIFVPLSKKLGLGSILGYLMGGLFIGPNGIGLVPNVEQVMHLSEFGVVLFLFVIGLELNLKKLWSLRVPIFGMGGLQVVANTLVFTLLIHSMGTNLSTAFFIAMGISLSSTAMALQTLNERNLTNTQAGSANFSILLFQDIAVIPMLSVIPLLGAVQKTNSLTEQLLSVGKTIGIILTVLVLGRLILRPVLRFIASIHLRDIFTAFALLLVMSMAFLMYKLDISMALGAFLGGVLLADSEYRHALETDIEPFKGLLLGLFFISVGMSVNLRTIIENPIFIIGSVIAIFLIKYWIHFGIGIVFKVPKSQRSFFSLVIAQVGEFAFVLYAAGFAAGIINFEMSEKLVSIVALTLFATPLVTIGYDYLQKLRIKESDKKQSDTIENQNSPVIIAGFGRYGQIVGRLLYANKISATVLDHEPDQIELLRRFGFKVYYGDATRLDLLESAGLANAKVLVIAIDDPEEGLKLAQEVQTHYPNLKIFSRARNIQYVYSLMDLNIAGFERETFESSLRLGTEVLRALGWSGYESVKRAEIFRRHNHQMIKDMYKKRSNDKDLIAGAKQAREDLIRMFEEENSIRSQGADAW